MCSVAQSVEYILLLRVVFSELLTVIDCIFRANSNFTVIFQKNLNHWTKASPVIVLGLYSVNGHNIDHGKFTVDVD